MYDLVTLGTCDLRHPDGHAVQSVLAQPKRLALLAVLALAHPHGYVRRDALLPLFWPELDEDRARAALRRARVFPAAGAGQKRDRRAGGRRAWGRDGRDPVRR